MDVDGVGLQLMRDYADLRAWDRALRKASPRFQRLPARRLKTIMARSWDRHAGWRVELKKSAIECESLDQRRVSAIAGRATRPVRGRRAISRRRVETTTTAPAPAAREGLAAVFHVSQVDRIRTPSHVRLPMLLNGVVDRARTDPVPGAVLWGRAVVKSVV